MYCSHCGTKASGNFCSACGTALAANASSDATPVLIPTDWSDLVDYDQLLRIPEVRDLIASHAARSKKKMTGEQFLELCDKFVSPLTAGVPLAPIAKVCQPIYAKLGVKTGKSQCEFFEAPAGTTLVRALCSLAEHGHELATAASASSGCVLEASLPSDILSFAGTILITIEQTAHATRVEAATIIPGQIYDWGKSNRCLATLFADLRQAARAA